MTAAAVREAAVREAVGREAAVREGIGREGAVSRAAVGELRRKLADVCSAAVDSLEIAATLEAQGLTAQAARERYGCPDVFALADQLYRRSARCPAEPDPEPELWRVQPAAHILRGLLYCLPGVCYPTMTPLLSGPGALGAVVVSMAASWSLSQGMSYLG